MSQLVFVSGDFGSGSTLLFTLFRHTGDYTCFYEPFHERLREYVIWPLRVYDHHYHVGRYFTEYKGLRELSRLFRPEWGTTRLHLPPEAEAEAMYRYLGYLIGAGFGRNERVMLKFNRATFRLGWLRRMFPDAKIVHVYRDPEQQWQSTLKRVQAYLGREDVGQGDVSYNGFNYARWCEDLAPDFPELAAKRFSSGYERFRKLWELSYEQHRRDADVSLDYHALTHEFEVACARLWDAIGYRGDSAALEPLVVPPQHQKPLHPPSPRSTARDLVDRAGRRYASWRVAHSGRQPT